MGKKKRKNKLLLPAAVGLLLSAAPLTVYADELLSVEPITSVTGEDSGQENSEESWLDKKIWESAVDLFTDSKDASEEEENFMNKPIADTVKEAFSGNTSSETAGSPEAASGTKNQTANATETANTANTANITAGTNTAAANNITGTTGSSIAAAAVSGSTTNTTTGTNTTGDGKSTGTTKSTAKDSSESEEDEEITEESLSDEITELDPLDFAKPFAPLTDEDVDNEMKSMVASIYQVLSVLAAAGLLFSVISAGTKLMALPVNKRPGSKEDILTELGFKVIIFGLFCSIVLIGEVIGILVGIL